MAMTMTKADGVTVFTLTSDPKSAWPPLCQILKALCYSPVCCSVSQRLRMIQKTSQSVLGVSYNLQCVMSLCFLCSALKLIYATLILQSSFLSLLNFDFIFE